MTSKALLRSGQRSQAQEVSQRALEELEKLKGQGSPELGGVFMDGMRDKGWMGSTLMWMSQLVPVTLSSFLCQWQNVAGRFYGMGFVGVCFAQLGRSAATPCAKVL